MKNITLKVNVTQGDSVKGFKEYCNEEKLSYDRINAEIEAARDHEEPVNGLLGDVFSDIIEMHLRKSGLSNNSIEELYNDGVNLLHYAIQKLGKDSKKLMDNKLIAALNNKKYVKLVKD